MVDIEAVVPGMVCETLAAADGLNLRVSHLPGPGRTVLILGGRTEFVEKYAETFIDLQRRGFAVVTHDWRGQGLSGRLLANPHKGHVGAYEDYIADLDTVIDARIPADQHGHIIVLAHSMGGHVALRYLHDRPGLIERAVLSAPMVDIFDHFAARLFATGLARAAIALGLSDATRTSSRALMQ